MIIIYPIAIKFYGLSFRFAAKYIIVMSRRRYRYFSQQVGSNTGSLPILIVPAVTSRSARYLRSMGRFATLLQASGKRVMVKVDHKYQHYFNPQTMFMSSGNKAPNTLRYSFWCYTTNGRVKNVNGLDRGVTMYAYNGTVSQYKQKYGQLTQ